MVQAFADDSDSVRLVRSLPAEYVENWKNEITLRSWSSTPRMRSGGIIERNGPDAALMIVLTGDTTTPSVDGSRLRPGPRAQETGHGAGRYITPFTARPSRRRVEAALDGSSPTSDCGAGRPATSIRVDESHVPSIRHEPVG